MSRYDEEALLEEAKRILGTDEEILGAGYFGLANLIGASVAGAAVGAGVGELADNEVAQALSAIAGRHLAVESAARAQGATLQLLVAITATYIHVLNRDTGGQLRSEYVRFHRDAVEVSVRKFGLTRYLTLTEPESGMSIELHGSVTRLSPQSTGDRIVLDLLAEKK